MSKTNRLITFVVILGFCLSTTSTKAVSYKFVSYKTDEEKAQLECAKQASSQSKVSYDEAYDECMKKKGFPQ
jgi:hypothetical protein